MEDTDCKSSIMSHPARNLVIFSFDSADFEYRGQRENLVIFTVASAIRSENLFNMIGLNWDLPSRALSFLGLS